MCKIKNERSKYVENSKIAIYKIISIFLAAAKFILGLVTGIRLENIAVFF